MREEKQDKGSLGRIALLAAIVAALVAAVVGTLQIIDRTRTCKTDLEIYAVQVSEHPCVEFLVHSSCTQLLTTVAGTVTAVEDTSALVSIEDLSSVSVSRTYDIPVKIGDVTTVGWVFEREIAHQVKAQEYDRFRLRLLLEDSETIELLSDRGASAVAVTLSLCVRSMSGKTVGSGEVRLVFECEPDEFGATAICEL